MEFEYIPFARPHVGKEEEEAVLRVLRSAWLTTGTEALAFEKEFAAFLDGPETKPSDSVSDSVSAPEPPPLQALAVNSATSGLHLALEACGIGPGDPVLLPSYTFTSTAEAARYLGAEPVFVDVIPGSFHMDPAALERTLARLEAGLPAYPQRGGFGPRGKATAVLPVHYGGLPCDMERIMKIARHRRLRVIEDAAHSFPSRIPGIPAESGTSPTDTFAGTLGDVGVFSFYATKTLTTGEGGMVVSRDQTLAKRISIMRSHGIDRTVWNRYTDKKASWYYEVVEAGFKYNIPDILAALGRVQLKKALFLLKKREVIARRYDEAFGGDGRFFLPPTGTGDARHLYPLRLNPEEISLTREDFIAKLQEQGIGVSVHFIPLHIMPYYRRRYALEAEDFPESVKSFKRVISIPIWPGMEENHVERVITAVKKTADMG
ncbi:MAG: DegT/DnrJ/EryC1/StrS aminotransferase family protein [Spirochaetaceae bacterium]|jgi:dTDP-4-amino-4,6-dideoxygalactose transaminase|nr:DegT/DnrJ/EryC1/StrS aminotransferase family protein [Spirochaetaceae bacterium]